MYDTYTCPLQPCTHLTLKLLTQGHPRSAEVTHIEDFKSAYISLIIKRPARDACLCTGELQAPPAPHFVFLITL